MTDSAQTPDKKIPGDRIAKVIARAGAASRRDAEVMIEEGRVSVNGRVVKSAALNVMPKDRILIDGKPLAPPEPPRLWLYHKPLGLVTTAKDEKGRETVFDKLPDDMPRVMSVGRLDLNSEGLLLLTNDGEIKRKLELPDTGWLRKYRVRVKGTASEATLDTLRAGIEIDGERFQPMEVVFDRQQGANAWLTVGIREGRNREIRRAMEAIGLVVNRLIRISYGPFRLGTLGVGAVEEVRARVLRDQLGLETPDDAGGKRMVSRGGKPGGPRKETLGRDARGPRPAGKPFGKRDDGDRKPFGKRDEGDRKPFGKRDEGDRKPFGKREDRDGKPFGKREDRGDKKTYAKRDDRGDKKPYAKREDGDRKPYAKREDVDRKPYAKRDDKGGKPFGKRTDRGDDAGNARGAKPFAKRDGKPAAKGGKPDFKSHGFKSHGGGAKGGKPRSAGFKSHKKSD